MPDRPLATEGVPGDQRLRRGPDEVLAHLASASVDELLDTLRSFTEMDVAFVGEFSTGRRIVRFVKGNSRATALLTGRSDAVVETYCRIVAELDEATMIPDVQADARLATLDITTLLDIGSYVGVPIRLSGGRLYGTLCAYSHRPVAELDPEYGAVLSVLAALIGRRLEAPQDSFFDVLDTQERIRSVLAASSIRVVLQPIVDLRSRRHAGYEALSRFPGERAEGPDAWFADAHRVGLGPDLELAAAADAVRLVDHIDTDQFVAVNLAVSTLIDIDTPDVLSAVPGNRLVIELTEHDRVSDHDLVRARERVTALGARVAVDDLGAGFAGLRRLVQVQPDIVKLDRFLTAGIAADPCRQALATATRSFCEAIGAVLIAEGVETDADLDALIELGVDHAQGFLLGRPGPLPTPGG